MRHHRRNVVSARLATAAYENISWCHQWLTWSESRNGLQCQHEISCVIFSPRRKSINHLVIVMCRRACMAMHLRETMMKMSTRILMFSSIIISNKCHQCLTKKSRLKCHIVKAAATSKRRLPLPSAKCSHSIEMSYVERKWCFLVKCCIAVSSVAMLKK